MNYESETLKKMIDDAGAKKTAICKKLNISRSTLDSWLKPGNDHLLNMHKVLQVAKAVNVDPLRYFSGMKAEFHAVDETVKANYFEDQIGYISSMIDHIVSFPNDKEIHDSILNEIESLMNDNSRYRKQVAMTLHQIKSLKLSDA
jgi:hypothetical protein